MTTTPTYAEEQLEYIAAGSPKPEPSISLRQLQSEQREWVARNFPGRDNYYPLLGAMEELGELAHAHLKGLQGIRHTPEQIRAMKEDAVADVVVFLSDYCTAEGIDFEAAVAKTWAEVRERDWQKDPMKGVTATDAIQGAA